MARRGIRYLSALAVAILAAFGLAQPASAAPPNWDPVSTSSAWHCAATQETPITPNVFFQACTVVSGSYGQIVLVVANDTGGSVNVIGTAYTKINHGDTINIASCGGNNGYNLPAHTRRGCFGKTYFLNCGQSIGGSVNLFVDQVSSYNEDALDHSHC